MRNAVVHRKLQHFGVNHDKFAFFRPHSVKQGDYHRVYAHGFTGTGSTGNQQVGHFGQIGINVLSADVFTQSNGQSRFGFSEFSAFQKFAQIYDFPGRIRQLNADGVAARNNSYTNRNRAHRTRYVVGQTDNPGAFGSRRRLQLIQSHYRARTNFHNLAVYAKFLQNVFKFSRDSL